MSDEFFSSSIFVALIYLTLVALGSAVTIIWARRRWQKLGPELFPKDPETAAGPAAAAGTAQGDASQLGRALEPVKNWLVRLQSAEAQYVADEIAEIEGSKQAVAAINDLAGKAMASGNVATLLLGAGDCYAYVVVVPGRHEHLTMLRRYDGFSAGWCNHLAALRSALAASGPFSKLAGCMFFLSPERGESLFLYSFADQARMLVPTALMQPEVQRWGAVEPLDAALEFDLAA